MLKHLFTGMLISNTVKETSKIIVIFIIIFISTAKLILINDCLNKLKLLINYLKFLVKGKINMIKKTITFLTLLLSTSFSFSIFSANTNSSNNENMME